MVGIQVHFLPCVYTIVPVPFIENAISPTPFPLDYDSVFIVNQGIVDVWMFLVSLFIYSGL